MSLLDRVQKDSQRILNSEKFGFSTPLVLTDPSETAHDLKGIVSVIHNLIDPDTGQPVSGFLATVSLNALDLRDKGIDMPEGEMDSNSKPWKVQTTVVGGVQISTKVTRVAQDETNGNILIDLGNYEH